MANITRIKAQDPHKKRENKEPEKEPKKAPKKTEPKQVEKAKKPFFLIRPFVALGAYIKASWHELRQVRWPSRKYTWKMTAAMLVYCLIFLVIIVLLDLLFSFIFNHLLG